MAEQNKNDIYTPIIVVLLSLLTVLVIGTMIVKGL